jgi:hypothetical protein
VHFCHFIFRKQDARELLKLQYNSLDHVTVTLFSDIRGVININNHTRQETERNQTTKVHHSPNIYKLNFHLGADIQNQKTQHTPHHHYSFHFLASINLTTSASCLLHLASPSTLCFLWLQSFQLHINLLQKTKYKN